MIEVLFVCRTNAVLSPLAAGIFNLLASRAQLPLDAIKAASRGTYPGNTTRPADRRAIACAEKHGFTIADHSTREISAADLSKASYVFCADEDSYWHIDRVAKEAGIEPNKSFRLQLLTEESRQLGQRTIPDPLLGESSFEETGELLMKYVTRLFERLIQAEGLKTVAR